MKVLLDSVSLPLRRRMLARNQPVSAQRGRTAKDRDSSRVDQPDCSANSTSSLRRQAGSGRTAALQRDSAWRSSPLMATTNRVHPERSDLPLAFFSNIR